MIIFGVIGVGHLGNFHLRQLSDIPDVNLSGLYDIDLIRALTTDKCFTSSKSGGPARRPSSWTQLVHPARGPNELSELQKAY